ncbi:hypothetical protein P154DRAFT_523423 [Amniculicola lignicola CBS 123094]|uniref:Uncharacterized protein n=1 Tax=Amniculicola lignicola CBS 123094 TaxID=1392246 RepID=A0A6A5WEG9_9PLEO|nr:hypothetical protein P154DRAFT_523423 [Amniculicola lignicola CBS 123094]
MAKQQSHAYNKRDLSTTSLLNQIPCLLSVFLSFQSTMALYQTLPDGLQEVDVIIAGGQYLPCLLSSSQL